MRAKDYMRQIFKLDFLIINKEYEKKMWGDMAVNTAAPQIRERVQSSGSQQKMADAIDECIYIQSLIDKYKAQKKEIIDTIEEMDAQDYNLLHQIYVQRLAYQDIADISDRSYSQVTTAHGRALGRLQKIIDERKENGTRI